MNKNIKNNNKIKRQNRNPRNGRNIPKHSKAPVSQALSKINTGPKIIRDSNSSRRIVHSELVGSINGSVAFEVNRYAVNPGLSATFPWLSSQADGWEQYRFRYLYFEFVTRTATSTVGSVILTPDYNPSDPNPADEKSATSYFNAVETAPWVDQKCHLSVESMFPLGSRKFIRNCEVSGDPKTFDAAAFFLCTVEEAGADPIGKLWVHYDVELFVPQTMISTPIGRISGWSNVGTQTVAASATPEFVVLDTERVNGLRLPDPSSGAITLPRGTYKVSAQVVARDSAAEDFEVSLYLYKNGSNLGYTATDHRTNLATGEVALSTIGYLSSDGTDTVSAWIELTGAAGTLTLLATHAFLWIEVV